MEYKILSRDRMLLVGLACDVMLADVQEKGTTIKLSEQFMSRRSEINRVINTREVFGVSTDPENYNQATDPFEYFIGVEVSSIAEIPDGMVYREIPSNEYVVFTFEGPIERAGQVHDYLYATWLRNHDYHLSGLYNIEVYNEGFKGAFAEESITDIYFPIRKNA